MTIRRKSSRSMKSPGESHMQFSYGGKESSLRTQGPQRERNCAHRGDADSRFGTGAKAFLHF